MKPIRVTLELPPRKLHPNANPHHRSKSEAIKNYRTHTLEEAQAACYEQGIEEPLTEAVVGITYYHPTMQFNDADNILASLKSAWDGFTRAGLWVDDRDVVFLPVSRKKDKDNPRVDVVIYPEIPSTFQDFLDSLEV